MSNPNPERSPRRPRVVATGVLPMLRVSRARAGRGVLVVLGLFALGAVAGPAVALALPEGRVYEMVSPVYKGGYGAGSIEAVAENGESVAFFSSGAFAGAPASAGQPDYIARRAPSGWSTTPLMPPSGMAPSGVMGNVTSLDVSPSLGSIMAFGEPGPNREGANQEATEEEFVFHASGLPDTTANWEVGGTALKTLTEAPFEDVYDGASADFCHLLVNNASSNLATESEALLPEAVGARQPLYDLARGCGGEPVSLHLVASNNSGAALSPSCLPVLGAGFSSSFNAISADGGEIFFTTCVNGKEAGARDQLFVRLGATRTLEVSRPLAPGCGEVPCAGAAAHAPAIFAGASEDGSRVFFTTAAPLVAGDTDSGNDLYMAQIGCPAGESECAVGERVVTALTQVSDAPGVGEVAEVQGVLRVAPDGSRAYFVARGVLSEAPNAQGAVAVRGADNLYVYDDTAGAGAGKVAFVGELCSGHGGSGTVADARCPSGSATDEELWQHGSAVLEAQTAGVDGRFLVYSSYAQLTGSDTDTAQDVYRYDAETGALDRVSGGEDGYDANGNRDELEEVKGPIGGVEIRDKGDATIRPGNLGGAGHDDVYEQYEMGSRAISEDGSRIVFMTAEPLSPDATNGLANVYEWHEQPGGEGSVSLISDGSAEEPVNDVVISPSGNDVFFTTTQGLVSQDTDGESDVYDARLERESGFPPAPSPVKACAGDACQGPLTNPAPLLVPGSVSQAPGGNFAAPAPVMAATPKKKATLKCSKGKRLSHDQCVKRKTKGKQAKAKKANNDHRRAS